MHLELHFINLESFISLAAPNLPLTAMGGFNEVHFAVEIIFEHRALSIIK